MKNNITHVKKYSCEEPLCIVIVIPQSTSSRFQDKKNYFQTYPAGFVYLRYLLEKGEEESMKLTSHNLVETKWLFIKVVGLVFNMGKVLLKCG